MEAVVRFAWSLLVVILVALAAHLLWSEHLDGPLPASVAPTASPAVASGAGALEARPTLQGVPRADVRPPRPLPARTDPSIPAVPEGSVEVHVLGPDGKPVPQFQARLADVTRYRKFDLQTAGRMVIAPPKPGVAALSPGSILEVWGACDTFGVGLGLAPQRMGPFKGDERTLELRLEEGPFVQGVVLGRDGPISVPVTIKMGPIDRWWEFDYADMMEDAGTLLGSPALLPTLPFHGVSQEVVTDRSARFQIGFTRPGVVHELSVDVPDGYCDVARREVRVGDAPIEIRLERPVTVRVTVLGNDGQPVKGVRVSALPQGSNGFDRDVSAMTKADGVAHVGAPDDDIWRPSPDDLDPTRIYKLVINANYGAGIVRERDPWRLGEPTPKEPPFLAEKAIEDWTPADTVVHLELGHTVSGRVVASDGRPVHDCHVGICTPVGFGVYSTSEEGRFAFHGVPRGTVYMGLDDGGAMGGIVDRQRETMWDAAFGGRKQYAPDRPPPVREWRVLDVSGDQTDVTFVLPATVSVEFVLPVAKEPRQVARELAEGLSDETHVAVLHRVGAGWEYFNSVWPSMMRRRTSGTNGLGLNGLLPGDTYAAWMRPVSGAYVYAEFRGDVGKVVLERQAGRAIEGRILGRPLESTRVQLSVWDDLKRDVRTLRPDAAGRFRVEGLPESTWNVQAWCRDGADLAWMAEGKVRTGASLDLRLVPKPERRGR